MLNKVMLIGNLGDNPNIRTFDNGDKVANFSIATSDKYTDNNGDKKEVTQWHNIVVYGNLVDVVEKWVKKGSKLYVEGKLKHRSYESDGVTKYITEVVLEKYGGFMEMLGGKNENSGDSSAPPPPPVENGGSEAPLETDQLPF